MKRDLLKTIVLMVSIVLVTVGSSLLLNLVTGPKIAADKAHRDELAAQQAAGALAQALPGATGFEEITSTLTIDSASGVRAVHKETSGKGYVVIAEKTNAPMKDMVVVTFGVSDGKVTGVVVEYKHDEDYEVSDATLGSFVGQDSTLTGVEITATATVSSNTIKEAVSAGMTVLAANNLMKAAEKDHELVFEELLSTVVTGFVTDKKSELTVSGTTFIYRAIKAKNDSCIVFYAKKADTKLLVVVNVSGAAAVYKAKLEDEATQTYSLADVTSEHADVVTEAKTFASSKISTTFSKLSNKVAKLYENATEIQELSINTFSSITAAASFVNEGVTYYAYRAETVNRYSGDPVMDIYIVLDSDGKIVSLDMKELYFNSGYWHEYPGTNEEEYKNQFIGLDKETYDGSQSLTTGATFSPRALDEAVRSVFAEFDTLGGNN